MLTYLVSILAQVFIYIHTFRRMQWAIESFVGETVRLRRLAQAWQYDST